MTVTLFKTSALRLQRIIFIGIVPTHPLPTSRIPAQASLAKAVPFLTLLNTTPGKGNRLQSQTEKFGTELEPHMLQDKFQPLFLYRNPLVHNIQARPPAGTSPIKDRNIKSVIPCTNTITHHVTCQRRRTLDRRSVMPAGASPLPLPMW